MIAKEQLTPLVVEERKKTKELELFRINNSIGLLEARKQELLKEFPIQEPPKILEDMTLYEVLRKLVVNEKSQVRPGQYKICFQETIMAIAEIFKGTGDLTIEEFKDIWSWFTVGNRRNGKA
jgi:hypothetical protein